ncbi:glutathione peroxidase [Paenibacillus sp. M1]|uniref:Glutathione peroxidase n=1 Tax=Paenibacillus haidiansis TaxID=1574488 RepID=A0ABU7VS82_9BACL
MSIYEFQVNSIQGKPVKLSGYCGKVLIIVNTASRCSYSRQFAGLERLYETYRGQGFEILGFPCNQFNGKEPDDSPEVARYCKANFGTTFPLFEKVQVRGPFAHPLFSYLTREAPFQGYDVQTAEGLRMRDFLREKYPEIYEGDGIKWNFTKFLIDRGGRVYKRYETTTKPSDIEAEVASLLQLSK